MTTALATITEKPVISQAAKEQADRYRQGRARMRKSAWKPKLIKGTPVAMPPNLVKELHTLERPRDVLPAFYQIINGKKHYFMAAPPDEHVLRYRMFLAAIDHIEERASKHEFIAVFDIQRWCLAQNWEIENRTIIPNEFTIRDLKSDRRQKEINILRQTCMYLCKHLSGRSYPFIGHKFGDRDHTTILHACGKTDERLANKSINMNGKPFSLERIGEI